ncbi:hypothetical protein H4R33_003867 [Dimargaris cristalligena]|nr:hypothetical protein H4R33_003867 [Dimargaris cristalligena]
MAPTTPRKRPTRSSARARQDQSESSTSPPDSRTGSRHTPVSRRPVRASTTATKGSPISPTSGLGPTRRGAAGKMGGANPRHQPSASPPTGSPGGSPPAPSDNRLLPVTRSRTTPRRVPSAATTKPNLRDYTDSEEEDEDSDGGVVDSEKGGRGNGRKPAGSDEEEYDVIDKDGRTNQPLATQPTNSSSSPGPKNPLRKGTPQKTVIEDDDGSMEEDDEEDEEEVDDNVEEEVEDENDEDDGMDEDVAQDSNNEESKKKVMTKEELALKRSENARRRKFQTMKKIEQDQMDTINRLLKKQASKRSRKDDADQDGDEVEAQTAFPQDIRLVVRPDLSLLAIPMDCIVLSSINLSTRPAPRAVPLCSFKPCTQTKKYTHPNKSFNACSLDHYKMLLAADP